LLVVGLLERRERRIDIERRYHGLKAVAKLERKSQAVNGMAKLERKSQAVNGMAKLGRKAGKQEYR